MSSAIIIEIPRSSSVKIIDSSDKEWWKVYYEYRLGYVHSSLFTNPNYQPPVSETKNTKPIFVTNNNVNLRARMSTSSKIIIEIPASSIVNVIDSSHSTWWKVSYKGKTGFVHNSFIQKR